MMKCSVDGCKSYFACREDLEEHMSVHQGHQPGRGVTRPQPDGREDILPSEFKGLSLGAGTATDIRRTNATTPSRGATSSGSDVSTSGGISVTGNEGSQVFLGRSTTSKTGQSKSGVVSVTGNKGSQIFCGSSDSSSTSGTGQNTSGDFTVIGNKRLQLCVTSSRSSAASGARQSQPGFIVADNENVQMLSDGSKAGNVNVRKNTDAQLYHGVSTHGAAAHDVNLKDNEESQVFIPSLGGEDAASEIQRDDAEGAPESMTPEDAQD